VYRRLSHKRGCLSRLLRVWPQPDCTASVNTRGSWWNNPPGSDLESLLQIKAALGAHFHETQIYRIDHFPGKESVQNILALGFANPILEPVWNRNYMDHVVITVAETLGVEHRASYYEHAGALHDMVQNHLLQLLYLVAMEPPAVYGADDIRNRKMDVMHALHSIPETDMGRPVPTGHRYTCAGSKLPETAPAGSACGSAQNHRQQKFAASSKSVRYD